jgi:hypothetical protein
MSILVDRCPTLTTPPDCFFAFDSSPPMLVSGETSSCCFLLIGEGDPEFLLARLVVAGNMPILAPPSLAPSVSEDSASLSALRFSL